MSQSTESDTRRRRTPRHRDLLEVVEAFRLEASQKLDPRRRAEMGQFFTPAVVSRFMASMYDLKASHVRLLDAGAGVGSLTAAWVAEICSRRERPREVSVVAYEVDPALTEYLAEALKACKEACEQHGIAFLSELIVADFIRSAVRIAEPGLSFSDRREFDFVILNPPYRKLGQGSKQRELMRTIQCDASNLYTAFLLLASRLLTTGGQLVAITPRSFCNGPYFRAFRRSFLSSMAFRRVHVYDSRSQAFNHDDVLQENIVFSAFKTTTRPFAVVISSNEAPGQRPLRMRLAPYDEVVRPDDAEQFIRVEPDSTRKEIAVEMQRHACSLSELGVSVSTGRVVAFRAAKYLSHDVVPGSVPLIHPGNIAKARIQWPRVALKKPCSLAELDATMDLLVPSGVYVVVKRFTSKEERRRVVAALYDPEEIVSRWVGFENHLNYYHIDGGGLPRQLAEGLVVFLNSDVVDAFFRQFSGHTQVNATDLRSLRYPTREELEALGAQVSRVTRAV